MFNHTLRLILLALAAMTPLAALKQPLPTVKQVTINFQALQNYQVKDQTIALQVDAENKDNNSFFYLKAANTARGQRYLLVVQRLDGSLVIKAPVNVKKDGSLTRTDRDERVEIPVDRIFPGERMECFLVSENGQIPLAKIGFTPHPIIAWLSDGPSVSATLMDVDANHYLILGKNFQPHESIRAVTAWGEQQDILNVTADASGAFRTVFSPVQESRRGGVSTLTFESTQGTINFRLPWGIAYYTWAVHVTKEPRKEDVVETLNGFNLAGKYLSPTSQQL